MINDVYPLHIVRSGSERGRKRTISTECGDVLCEGDANWGNAIDICLVSVVNNRNWCHKCVLSRWDVWDQERKDAWQKLGIVQDSQ